MIFNYWNYGKWHSGTHTQKLPYICQREEKNFGYRNILMKLEKLIKALRALFNNSTLNDVQDRSKRSIDSDMCSEIMSLWKRFGELKDGPVFSLSKINVSSLTNEQFMATLKKLNSSENFKVTDCGLQDHQVYVVQQGIEELTVYLENKRFNDTLENWVDDETCVVGSPGTSSGTN